MKLRISPTRRPALQQLLRQRLRRVLRPVPLFHLPATGGKRHETVVPSRKPRPVTGVPSPGSRGRQPPSIRCGTWPSRTTRGDSRSTGNHETSQHSTNARARPCHGRARQHSLPQTPKRSFPPSLDDSDRSRSFTGAGFRGSEGIGGGGRGAGGHRPPEKRYTPSKLADGDEGKHLDDGTTAWHPLR